MNNETIKNKIEKVIDQAAKELSQVNESQPVITEELKERPARPDALESKLMAEYKARQVAESQLQSSSLSQEKSTKR